MSVNGITESISNNYTNYTPSAKAADSAAATKKVAEDTGVVYEPSASATSNAGKTYTQNTELVNKLKADAEARTKQLQDIVTKLMTKQGVTYNHANGLKSIFEALEVDPATRAQAQADIAEDGYWGVKQTSERIFDFAKALTGGDPEKMEEMREAFLKGFKQAEEMWGDSLPEISQKTYGAVLEKFDSYANENSNEKVADAAAQTMV